jgi:uncharacterized protein (TIGR02284 family)
VLGTAPPLTCVYDRFAKPTSERKETQVQQDVIDELKKLHTNAIDARKGYEEALEDAEGKGMTPLFKRMIALHAGNASELTSHLNQLGEQPDQDGSFMAHIHRTIFSIRGLFGGLDESVLPGLIDGEERNASAYEDAMKLPEAPSDVRSLLTTQRGRIETEIAGMRAAKA